MKNNKAAIFNVILDTFENEDIKELTVKMIEDIPDYFFFERVLFHFESMIIA